MINDDIAIELTNVSKRFVVSQKGKFSKPSTSEKPKVVGIKNISLTVKKGEFIGIVGRNGSGKTTLLRTIAGIFQPDSGSVVVHGVIAPILSIGTGFHRDLNAYDNIIMSGLFFGIKKSVMEKKFDSILKFAELEDFTEMKLRHYSTGMKARLAFSTAIQINPDILLVDEILSVGDKKFKKKSFEEFMKFKEQGKTILLTTHSIGKLVKSIDRVVLLDNGKISMVGTPDEVISKYEKD